MKYVASGAATSKITMIAVERIGPPLAGGFPAVGRASWLASTTKDLSRRCEDRLPQAGVGASCPVTWLAPCSYRSPSIGRFDLSSNVDFLSCPDTGSSPGHAT